MSLTLTDIAEELETCQRDFSRFNSTILGRGELWSRQREIANSIINYPTTLAPTGNAVGKTYCAAGLIPAFLATHPNCLVLVTAPSQTQLEEVLWKEVERAYRGARVPLGGRLLRSPLKIDFGGGWQALAYSTTRVERFSGHHAGDVFAVGDEASGIAEPVWEAIASLNPSREFFPGNPLRPEGTFYERCQAALSGKNPLANVIHVSSLESPHIHLERSPWGLADATWLQKARYDYGEGSLWWTVHVLGLFPDAGDDTLIPRSWIDRCVGAQQIRTGPTRTTVDLAQGMGGDRTVVMTRDDGGILDLEHSRHWSLEVAATRVALQAQKWGVEHHRVVYDGSGIGADFGNRLRAVRIEGSRAYRGGATGGARFSNLRTAAAWMMRQRFDPRRVPEGVTHDQPPFAIRPDWLRDLRPELQGLRYKLTEHGTELESAEDFATRLKHSPDLAATLIMSFAFPG